MSKLIFEYKEIDWSIPLKNKKEEKFCQRYYYYDRIEPIRNEHLKRETAYREAFNYEGENGLNLATRLFKKDKVRYRVEHLLNHGIDLFSNQNKWGKEKAEDFLLNIITDNRTKAGEKIKAIEVLNTLSGIGKEDNVADALNELIEKARKRKINGEY